MGFPGGSDSKESTAMRETWVRSLSQKDPLKEGMTIHSSILAWRIPVGRGAWWATVHGSQRVGHRATKHISINIKMRFDK